MTATTYRIEPNPDYGRGLYRRRVGLQQLSPGEVLAELEDDQHGFRVRLRHDGERIIAVQAEALRVPMNTCGGAVLELSKVRGALSHRARDINQYANSRANCTHLFDLLGFAVSHSLRAAPQRQYDTVVHDEQADGSQRVTGAIDGEPVFDWSLRDNVIQNPGTLHQVNTQKGFAAWAEQHLSTDEQELGLVIQRSLIVAITRRISVPALDGMPLLTDPMGKGICYSYSEPALSAAYRRGDNARDFEHVPELLLRFV